MSGSRTRRDHRGRKPAPTGGAGIARQAKSHRAGRSHRNVWLLVAGASAVAAVAAVVLLSTSTPSQQATGVGYPYVVGSPGPGAQAPPIRLKATDGSTFDLGGMRGKRLLLFFQEGIGCQPCWEQLKDIESNMTAFKARGIDEVITVTGDPAGALNQKVTLEGLHSRVLSDPGLAVSITYHANSFGMMGNSTDGHSFVVVGPDGQIQWRADYGGPPDYTMYIPVSRLLSDMKLPATGS